MRPRRRVGRLVHKAAFERLLACPPRARSAHFAAHHLVGAPSAIAEIAHAPVPEKLSTDVEQDRPRSVDNFEATGLPQHWLGVVLPKKHARRAVTRNLIRRLIRSRMLNGLHKLPSGMWLIRLRAAYPAREFISAASPRLRGALSGELDTLFAKASG